MKTTVSKLTSLSEIISLLPEAYATDPMCERQRLLVDNINGILKREAVKSVVMEEYIDRHFIHDFCGHYGSCYHDYPKKCIRLHFFTNEFNGNDFRDIITNTTDYTEAREKLGEYIGNVVVRPLPSAIFGNVTLKAPAQAHNTHIITKNIVAHLCGLEISVTTVPFQEQDKAISACATSALWVALQAVPGNLPHNVPSPHRLTEKAKKALVEGIKSHEVAKGLTISQMAWAAKNDNLTPLIALPPSTSYLKALLRAYLNAQIPVVMGIRLYYSNDTLSEGIKNKIVGNHAVTVLGYSEGEKPLKPFDAPDMVQYHDIEPRQLFLRSSALKAIFCHDDQIGPYSLMSFPDEYSPALTTDWGKIGNYGSVNAKVLSILIPCNPKVRIRFSKMYDIVKALNHVLIYDYNKLFGYQVTWDIRLETVCQLKAKLRSLTADELSSEVKYRILSTSMPRYIWVVDQYLYKNGLPIKNNSLGVSYLFDATDIENSDFLMMAIHYQQEAYIVNRVSFTLQPQDQNLLPPPYIVRKLMDAYYRDDKDKIFVSSN